MKIAMVLASLLTAARGDSFVPTPRDDTEAVVPPSVECIPCDVMFSELRSTESGGRVQDIQMQLRGEPKSGTGLIHQWASGLLHHACDFLKRSYGEDTCSVSWTREELSEGVGPSTNRSLNFDPRRGSADAPCSCPDVDRVTISVSKRMKHTLPVDPSCRYWRPNKIVAPGESHDSGCHTFKGSVVSDYSDLVGCMQEAACRIIDDRAQMVIMRDPRAVAVSSYFHRKRNSKLDLGDVTLEEYVPEIITNICKCVAIRYVLFSGLMQTKSTVYWYDDVVAGPLASHRTFSDSVGLHLPASVVDEAVDADLRGDYPFIAKTIDVHYESGDEEVAVGRTWRDDLGHNEDVMAELDAVMRVWMPPVLLAKWGLALAV